MSRNDNHNHEHSEHNENPAHNEHPVHNEHPNNHPTHNDPRPFDARDLFTEPYMPGLVQVEFKDPADSGVVIGDFDDARARRRPADRWCGDLMKVLRDYRMVAWKPSFPLTYPWSRQSKEEAIRFYEKSGRQRFVTFRFPDDADVVQIAAALKNVPEIERAKAVAKARPPQIDDPLFGQSDQLVVQLIDEKFENQWYAFRCNLPQTLEQVRGKGVVIAAIDWGFDVSHPDYSNAIKLTKNVYYDNDTVGNGNLIHHGTGTLGLAGARLDAEGMVGFAPYSILWAIQAGEDDDFNPDYWVSAIDFVREEPSPHRKVIILEAQTAFRGNIESNVLINQAIRDAIAANIVVCVPAGNGAGDAGYDDQDPPEVIPETGSILVGATSVNDVVISKSGDRVVVYAPGDPAHDITCTSLPDRYTNFFGGTSGAVAKVGGAAALLLDADDSLTPPEIKDLLRRSEKPVYDANGDVIPNAVLLDCGYSVYSCAMQKQPERVLTNYSAVV